MATKVSVRVVRKGNPKILKANRVPVHPAKKETISLLELITGMQYGVDKEITRKKYGLWSTMLSTWDVIIVECAPRDKVWSCGLYPWDPCLWNLNVWKGYNLQGELLMKVREMLGNKP